MINFDFLVNKAIKTSIKTYPEICDGFDIHNISNAKKERILYYLLQTYPSITKDETLMNPILNFAIAYAYKRHAVYSNLYIFIADYLAERKVYTLPDKNTIDAPNITELINFILARYPAIVNDPTLLQGVAIFARTDPHNWWD